MTKLEKFIIAAWVLFLLFIIWAISIPNAVQSVNNCCSSTECATQHHHANKTKTLTNENLRAWYVGFNEDYFFNRLPKNVEVHWSDLPTAEGETIKHLDGSWSIIIDRATNPTSGEVGMTIAHETCHVATWGQEESVHGSKFQNCMVNLATHGAFEGIW